MPTIWNTPPAKNVDWFLARCEMYHDAGFGRLPWFSYETIKYMQWAYPSLTNAYYYNQMTTAQIAQLKADRIRDLRLLAADLRIAVEAIKADPQKYGPRVPYFSIADEPHGHVDANGVYAPDSENDKILLTSQILKEELGSDFVALGNVNSVNDLIVFRDALDVWQINGGYGLDKVKIDSLLSLGKTVWFYNVWPPRAYAGFYAWRCSVVGYAQWNANSIVALPYDLTDGRESDVTVLYYSGVIDPPVRDIHGDLAEMTEGITDRRWCAWIDQQIALGRPGAGQVRNDLTNGWSGIAGLPDCIGIPDIYKTIGNRRGIIDCTMREMNLWRRRIIHFAKTGT